MNRTRTFLASALASTALLGAGATAANAQFWPGWIPAGIDTNTSGVGAVRSGACGLSSGTENQGGTAATNTYTCVGAGGEYVGYQVGQVVSVIGPALISPGAAGSFNTSAGNGAVNTLP